MGRPLNGAINFKAYNNATDVYYTLSNDDENLYCAWWLNNILL
jgi:hypothetical protein